MGLRPAPHKKTAVYKSCGGGYQNQVDVLRYVSLKRSSGEYFTQVGRFRILSAGWQSLPVRVVKRYRCACPISPRLPLCGAHTGRERKASGLERGEGSTQAPTSPNSCS